MKKIKGFNPVTRAVGVFGAVAIIVGAVTYAALQSTATLSDNSVSSATATLKVNNLENGGGYVSNDLGFDFAGLIPGDDYSEAQQFSLKNTGSAHLFVNIFATSAATEDNIDPSKVWIKLTNKSLSTPGSAEYTLEQLQTTAQGLPGLVVDDFLDNLGEENEFDIQVKLAEDAITGSEGGTIDDFDLVFTGTATALPAGSVDD